MLYMIISILIIQLGPIKSYLVNRTYRINKYIKFRQVFMLIWAKQSD